MKTMKQVLAAIDIPDEHDNYCFTEKEALAAMKEWETITNSQRDQSITALTDKVRKQEEEIHALHGFRDHLLNEIERLKGLLKNKVTGDCICDGCQELWQQFKTDNKL